MEVQKLLGAEAVAFRRMSPALYPTTCNVDNLEAYICSTEHLKESVMGQEEALHQGFVMGIKLALFNVTKSLEDYRIALDRS
jgi:hypothetical protein